MTRNLPTFAKAASMISPALVVGLVSWSAAAHDIRDIGDGKFSSSPQSDYLYSCQTQFSANAPGAHTTGPWLDGDTYDLDQKPTVDGEVTWPNARINISVDGDTRIVSANNLPTHATGNYPIAPSDDAHQYDRNPGTIREQDILLRLPANPEVADGASCVPMGMIGFTLTNGALYNAIDARGRDAAAYEILDNCGGHPQRDGQYHYHDDAACLPHGHEASGHSELIGYALDGFGIYGPDGVGGVELTNADLDACHGHVGQVTWDGEVKKIYHYHMTNQYPYSIGCFRGTPVTGSARMAMVGTQDEQPGPQAGAFGLGQGQPPMQARRRPQGRPPMQGPGGGQGGDPLVAVAEDLGVDVSALRRAVGAPPPDLRRASQELGIPMAELHEAFMRHRPR